MLKTLQISEVYNKIVRWASTTPSNIAAYFLPAAIMDAADSGC